MATKAQVRAALKKMGGAWDEKYDTFDSPKGMVWEASGCHSIAAAYDDLETIPKNYDGFIEQILGGCSPCEDPDCEICEEG
jgi:hypothetical protein